MPSSASATPLKVELRYRKEAMRKVGGKMKRIESRFAELPDVPAQFVPMTDTYQEVSKVATRLNESQLRSDFLDYLFFPEVASAPRGHVGNAAIGSAA